MNEKMEMMRGLIFEDIEILYVNDVATEIVFKNNDFEFRFYHEYDCCESVYIESITGEIEDLINEPIHFIDESKSPYFEDTYGLLMGGANKDECIWTFYKFGTRKGYVDIRWIGGSNGYYSVEIHIEVKDLRKVTH